MVLAGLPLPLAVPFGYFPFSEKYSSGIIFPTFGDDYNRGYYLSNGGYYLALSDNIDLALTGEIYTLGSRGLRAESRYVKRYKYSGGFNISYLKTITGDKGMPDYTKSTNFRCSWNHSRDSKANPQHESLGKRELHHQRLYAKRPELILLKRFHRKHKEQYDQHDLPFSQLKMVRLDNSQHLPALPGLNSCRLFSPTSP